MVQFSCIFLWIPPSSQSCHMRGILSNRSNWVMENIKDIMSPVFKKSSYIFSLSVCHISNSSWWTKTVDSVDICYILFLLPLPLPFPLLLLLCLFFFLLLLLFISLLSLYSRIRMALLFIQLESWQVKVL